MSEHGVADIPSAALAWYSDGDGAAIVLIHAGVADARMWDDVVPTLSARYRVLRYDMRGFGRSRSEPGAAFSDCGDLAALLAALDIPRAHVVGASFGGQVALELAAAQPERAASLVLLAPALPDHDESAEIQAYGEAEEAAIEEGRIDDAVELNLRMWVDGPTRTPQQSDPRVRALVADMQRTAFELQLREEAEDEEFVPPVSERLAQIGVPVTIAVGDLDVADYRAIGERLAAELPQATLHGIAGAGHLLALEHPDEVAQLVTRHLDDVS